jgi:AcrR family transcriptional regulator
VAVPEQHVQQPDAAGRPVPHTGRDRVPDRRVRRTRRLLQEALVGLLVQRADERITVQDVLDRADVGRSTFYAHFRDKQALFESCFDDLREDLRRELDALAAGGHEVQPDSPVRVVFEHADRHRALYRAMCGRRGETVATRYLHRTLVDSLYVHLDEVGTRYPAAIIAEYHGSALAGVLVRWIREDFPVDPATMARICRDLTAAGVTASLSDPSRHG